MDPTIVILFFNKPKLTIRCLHSVFQALKVAGKTKHQILLINNGSQPNALREVCSTIGDGFQVYTLNSNQGFSRAANFGLTKAFSKDCQQAMLLSNDVELTENFFCHNWPSLDGILCPEVYYSIDRTKPAYTHGTVTRVSNKLNLRHCFDPNIRRIQFPNYYPAAAMIWSKSAFVQTGGFNEAFFCYWEDVELSYRCRNQGIELISCPSLRVHHLGQGTTKGKRRYQEEFLRGEQLCREIFRNYILSPGLANHM